MPHNLQRNTEILFIRCRGMIRSVLKSHFPSSNSFIPMQSATKSGILIIKLFNDFLKIKNSISISKIVLIVLVLVKIIAIFFYFNIFLKCNLFPYFCYQHFFFHTQHNIHSKQTKQRTYTPYSKSPIKREREREIFFFFLNIPLWPFRNHYNMLICCLRNIYYYYYQCWKQLCCWIFLWKQ